MGMETMGARKERVILSGYREKKWMVMKKRRAQSKRTEEMKCVRMVCDRTTFFFFFHFSFLILLRGSKDLIVFDSTD